MSQILLIEDDKFLVRVYAVKLKKLNLDTTILTDGTSALATAKKEKPKLVILDLVMPNKDGFEVLRELKTDPETKNIPVIVLSALSRESESFAQIGVQPDRYLTKSEVSFDRVIDEIRTFL